MTLSWAALGFGTGAMVGLRVMADAKRSFRARLIVAPFLLVVPPAAVYLGGATGAAIGLAVVSCLTAVVWWAYYRMSVKASETEPAATLDVPVAGGRRPRTASRPFPELGAAPGNVRRVHAGHGRRSRRRAPRQRACPACVALLASDAPASP